jgi:dTDP-4-amino-4,6-dideoxygalactose transaminase
MQVLNLRVSLKRKIRDFYEKIFNGIEGIKILKENSNSFSNAWLSCILIDPKKTGFSREKLRLAFEKNNIEARPLWKPMHLQPIFKNFPAYLNGVSEQLFSQGLCLPSDTNMKENEFKRVKKVINKILKE